MQLKPFFTLCVLIPMIGSGPERIGGMVRKRSYTSITLGRNARAIFTTHVNPVLDALMDRISLAALMPHAVIAAHRT